MHEKKASCTLSCTLLSYIEYSLNALGCTRCMYFKKLIEIRIKRVGQWINVILSLFTGGEVIFSCTLCTLAPKITPNSLVETSLVWVHEIKCKISENKFDYLSISAKFILTSERNRSQPTLQNDKEYRASKNDQNRNWTRIRSAPLANRWRTHQGQRADNKSKDGQALAASRVFRQV